MPTMPASPMRAATSSGSKVNGSGGDSRSSHWSAPSLSSVMVGNGRPDTCGAVKSPTAEITPEVGACTEAETPPCSRPSNWPLRTVCPTLTTGSAGRPVCCCSGTYSRAGIGKS